MSNMATKYGTLPKKINHLEQTIGYTFRNKEYLTEALRHSSYANENRQYGFPSNERLEFLGDSVLSIITSEYLFMRFAEQPEGGLTKLRAELVCTESLADFAEQISLGDYLLIGHGEELRGSRKQPKLLEDAFEALLAAIFLDSDKDLDTVARFLRPLIIARADKLLAAREVIDPKSYLQEIVQEAKGLLEYEIVSESGPDHNKVFVCEVKIDHNVMGRGEGSSKKKAEIAAAHDALKNYIR